MSKEYYIKMKTAILNLDEREVFMRLVIEKSKGEIFQFSKDDIKEKFEPIFRDEKGNVKNNIYKKVSRFEDKILKSGLVYLYGDFYSNAHTREEYDYWMKESVQEKFESDAIKMNEMSKCLSKKSDALENLNEKFNELKVELENSKNVTKKLVDIFKTSENEELVDMVLEINKK